MRIISAPPEMNLRVTQSGPEVKMRLTRLGAVFCDTCTSLSGPRYRERLLRCLFLSVRCDSTSPKGRERAFWVPGKCTMFPSHYVLHTPTCACTGHILVGMACTHMHTYTHAHTRAPWIHMHTVTHHYLALCIYMYVVYAQNK